MEVVAARQENSSDRDQWRDAIQSVLAGVGLRLAAQPIVDVVNATVVGFELNARFSGPPDATPDVWFAHANELGLGVALDAEVVRTALTLRNQLPPDTFLSINIDPVHLRDEQLIAAFSSTGTLDGIVIELTEHSAIDDYQAIVDALAPLRRAGAKIAIDDAGSGYAGLQWIMALSPDLIKLDRTLVDHIDEDEIKTALVEMLGAFADRIDAWVLAEGIERLQELDVILRLGIPLAQGYLLARPALELWPVIDENIVAHLHSRAQIEQSETTLASLVETVAKRGVDTDPVSGTCVVVDGLDRPICLDLPDRRGAKVLTIRPNESVRSALERATMRAAVSRWQPLVCVNDERQTLGIVRMERLIHAFIRVSVPDQMIVESEV